MNALTITHTAADGTLIEGTSKGDGTGEILKAGGWRWSRHLGSWYVPRSRDTLPRTALIEATRTQLEAAGHRVTVDVDPRPRAFVDAEADRVERMGHRAEVMQHRAERATAHAEVAAAAEATASQALPPGGEPIHVGHHSEGRHRRAIDRARATLSASVAADARAADADRRAATAGIAVDARYSSVTVANRIDRLSSELRAELRRLARFDAAAPDPARAVAHRQLRERVEHLEQEVTYWTEIRAQQITDGVAHDYGPHNVAAGDQVLIRGHWYPVVRANRKTVTVPSSLGSWTDTAPWQHVADHRPTTKEQQP